MIQIPAKEQTRLAHNHLYLQSSAIGIKYTFNQMSYKALILGMRGYSVQDCQQEHCNYIGKDEQSIQKHNSNFMDHLTITIRAV